MSFLVVAYDIPDDTRRRKVARALIGLGRRLQYSVFLLQDIPAATVVGALEPLVDKREDRVLLQPLCMTCHGKMHQLAAHPPDDDLPAGFRIV